MNNLKIKLIGQGWQYRVYDLGNGRVLKKKRGFVNQFLRIFFEPLFSGRHSLTRTLKEMRQKNSHMQRVLSIIEKKISKNKINSSFLGNPRLINDFDHEQDKVTVLKDYFLHHSEDENKKVIDKYIRLLLDMWQVGLSDFTFNFLINNGINAEGRVVAMDLGELTDSIDEIRECVIKRKWLNKISFHDLQTQGLKDYFTQNMDRNINIQKLEEFGLMAVI